MVPCSLLGRLYRAACLFGVEERNTRKQYARVDWEKINADLFEIL
jgi:hypothetical protein